MHPPHLPRDLWGVVLSFCAHDEDLFIATVPRVSRTFRRIVRSSQFVQSCWWDVCGAAIPSSNSSPTTSIVKTADAPELVEVMMWMHAMILSLQGHIAPVAAPHAWACRLPAIEEPTPNTSSSTTTSNGYSARHWDDDVEMDLPPSEVRTRMLSCLAETSGECFIADAELHTTPSAPPERLHTLITILHRHSFFVKAQDYSWVNRYTENYSTHEHKKSRYVTLVGPTGHSAALRYYEVDLEGDFPKFFCRLDAVLGTAFRPDWDEAGLPLMQVGFGRVEVDVRPQVHVASLRRLAKHLLINSENGEDVDADDDKLMLQYMWNAVIIHSPLERLSVHDASLRGQYGVTLRDVVRQQLC
eukprot:PhM_4_TR7333/c0_g1_i1/m.84839